MGMAGNKSPHGVNYMPYVCDESPDAELAIIDGFGPTQMDFIENGMFSKNLFIRGYAKEILDNLETTCLAHYKVRLDTYLAKSVPGKVSKIREPGKVIDIASSKKFFRSESPSI